MKKLYFAILVAAMLILVTAPVQAALATWEGYFTSDHMTDLGGAGTPPFGLVTLTQVGTIVDFDVELYNNSKFMVSGAGGYFNFVFNGTDVAYGDITGSGLTVNSALIHADGTGDWSFGVVFTGQGTGGSNALLGPLQFTVANATIAELIVGNGSNIFAADILSGQTGNTGMVDVTSQVPIPAAAWLLGSGLIGLVALKRRNKK